MAYPRLAARRESEPWASGTASAADTKLWVTCKNLEMKSPSTRRRLYLMRHGSVDYFDADRRPVPPETVPLNQRGQQQADAAGALFGERKISFDAVVVSGLPRTVETAWRVLAAAGQTADLVEEPALQEIRGGRLADIPPASLEHAFFGAFNAHDDVEQQRFLGGESVGELLDRALPAFDRWRADTGWCVCLWSCMAA